MPNHVHLVVTPTSTDGMSRALRAVHSQYAQRVNRMREITGHLWQGPYYSSALDAAHFVNAIRYVEVNPVKASLAVKAEDYPWECGRPMRASRRPASGLDSTLEFPEQHIGLVRLARPGNL